MQSPHRILVTGATGFVGRHLVPVLRAGGWQVTVVAGRGPAEDGHVLDVADSQAVERLFTSIPTPDVVVHLAASAHRRPETRSADYNAVNHHGARQVLAAAQRAGARRFVFFSSAAVYGEAGRREAIPECAERFPVGAYARSKRDAEDACFAALADGFPCFVLRPATIYSLEWLGDVRKRAYVPGLTGRVLLQVRGRVPRYSFCAIEHIVRVACLAAEGSLAAGVYNVADETTYTQTEVRHIIGHIDGVRRTLALSPRAVRLPISVAAAVAPISVRAALWSNYWKLMEGQTLDVSKLANAGVRLPSRLHDLVGNSSDAADVRLTPVSPSSV